jgi:predicted ATPase
VLIGSAPHTALLIASDVATLRSTGNTTWLLFALPYLGLAHAKGGQFHDAWRCITETLADIERSKQRQCEAEVHLIAGEIALMSPASTQEEAELHFNRSLAVARQQRAKSFELRAAMSLARLWRDQGKVQQARKLLAPVYGWFTEGFDTRDLKEAKALLGELEA